jgi:hypothetical protein
MVPLQSMLDSLRSFWDRGQSVERVGYLVGSLLLLSGVVHLGILIIDGGSWKGPLSLRKPTTFGVSFGLTLITIVWVASFLQLGQRTRVLLLPAFTVACAVETALVSIQAWRGVPSHFNAETTFDALIARTLAAGGFVLIAIVLVLTIIAFRRSTAVPFSLSIAIQAGFVVLCAAMAVGAMMIATGMALVFAGHPGAAYMTGGNLKTTHAVAVHAILVLPFLAWLLSFANWSEARRVKLVFTAAVGYALSVAVIAIADFTNAPLRELPVVADLLFELGVCSVLATVMLALFGVASAPLPGGVRRE